MKSLPQSVRLQIDILNDGTVRYAVPHLDDDRQRVEVDRFSDLLGRLLGGPMSVTPASGWRDHEVADQRTGLLRILLDAHRRRAKSRVVAFPSGEVR